MPRIHKADLRGKSLDELRQILAIAQSHGGYSDHDLQKVKDKIAKRIAQGASSTGNVTNDVEKKSGGFE